jgi:hypothetical protein
MKIKGSDIRVGRVLHEDDAFLTIEVAKSDDRPLNVEDGDRYLTLLFVRGAPTHVDPRRMVAWLPWEDADGK